MFPVNYKNKFLTGWLIIGVVLIFTSCKKDQREEIYPASLTIVNAIADNSSFVLAYFGDTQPKSYIRLADIRNGNSFDYATGKRTQRLTLFRNYDTVMVDKPFLKTSLELSPGSIYTYFIYGPPGNVRQKTVKENLPSRSAADSVANLRIANFFENRAIDLVQLEPVPGTMVTNLAYEQLSDFIKIPASTSTKNFRFEVRDHASGVVLSTLTEVNISFGTPYPNISWLFKARTMLVTGTWTNAGDFSAKTSTIGHY